MSYESFGEALQRLRESRGITQHRLGLLAQISPSNLNRIERGDRGVPEPKTLLAIADALNLSRGERQRLIEAALGETMLAKVEQYAVYLYLFLASDQELNERARALTSTANTNRPIRDFLASRGKEIDREWVRELFVAIADKADYEEARRFIASQLITRLIVDLDDGAVTLRLGPLAEALLAEDVAEVEKESSASA